MPRRIAAATAAFLCVAVTAHAADQPREPWISTWAATPAPRWNDDLPAPFGVPENLANQTVRQIARISVGGDQVRIILSNEFGTKPLTIGAASVGVAGKDGAVDAGSMKMLSWNGRSDVVIPPGAPMISDPVSLHAAPLSEVAVSIYLPKKTALSSVHWDGVQTAYISADGNKVGDASFVATGTTKSRLFLSGIWTDAQPASQSVVFFGDSITDGYCSTVDSNNRWPDHVAERLQAEGHPNVSVVNEAYSGDRVLTDGMGTDALSRFAISVLAHPRVSTVVMMMGINDIGWPGERAVVPDQKEPTAADIETGYRQIIDRAHAHGLRFVGVTLTPFIDTFKGTPGDGYYTPAKETLRHEVNDWIRANKNADGLIDFDKLLDDPANPGHILPAYDCGDHLHPNDQGYAAMAKAVDLNLLVPPTN